MCALLPRRPHVTFISGTNGSGKSAVLQALQCCLGVKASQVGGLLVVIPGVYCLKAHGLVMALDCAAVVAAGRKRAESARLISF